MNWNMPGSAVLHCLLEFAQIHVHWVSDANHIILCHPLLLLLSVFLSNRVFSSELALHIRWPNCWGFGLSNSPFNEYSGLISFRIDWIDLLVVRGTLKSLFQHHNSKASVLRCSVLFMVQLSHLYYMTTGKTIALIIQTFISKVMSLLFNVLSSFVIAFLPRSKCYTVGPCLFPMYISLHLLILNSQPFPPPTALGNFMSVTCVCGSTLLLD